MLPAPELVRCLGLAVHNVLVVLQRVARCKRAHRQLPLLQVAIQRGFACHRCRHFNAVCRRRMDDGAVRLMHAHIFDGAVAGFRHVGHHDYAQRPCSALRLHAIHHMREALARAIGVHAIGRVQVLHDKRLGGIGLAPVQCGWLGRTTTLGLQQRYSKQNNGYKTRQKDVHSSSNGIAEAARCGKYLFRSKQPYRTWISARQSRRRSCKEASPAKGIRMMLGLSRAKFAVG